MLQGAAPVQSSKWVSQLSTGFKFPLRELYLTPARMDQTLSVWKRSLMRLLREPIVHFFIVGALLFVTQRALGNDTHKIEIGPGLRADLTRQFKDQMGKAPDSAEFQAALQNWKSDEVLYREALREGLDREDASIRAILIDKLRARLAESVQVREPSDAELDGWLNQHRDLYETPVLYEYEYIVFRKDEHDAERRRTRAAAALKSGSAPSALGLRLGSAKINRQRIEQDFGPELCNQICSLPPGGWQALDGPELLLLVRMMQIEGGLPSREALRDRLIAGWKAAQRQQAAEDKTRALLGRYRFEERPQCCTVSCWHCCWL